MSDSKIRVIKTGALFWAAGFTVSPTLILIRPWFEHNVALIEHEKVHCGQMSRIGTLKFWFKYLFSRKFRLNAEAEAYATSVAFGSTIDTCAEYLSQNYFLGITQQEARAAILAKIPPGTPVQ